MCIVSMIGDSWNKQFPYDYPNYPLISREEFDKLKKEVEELKLLLKQAKQFDEATKQRDCEMDEKIVLIKKIADAVGVDMKDVFKDESE